MVTDRRVSAATGEGSPALDLAADVREWRVLLGTLALVFVAFQLHLSSVIISDMDEGTYVYAGKLIAAGQVPYRDFLLTHPPLIALFAAAAQALGASLMGVRALYLLIVLAMAAPLYALARKAGATQGAALLAVVTYTSGMLMLANMGRTVRLEPMMNAFLIGAVACRFLRPRSMGGTAPALRGGAAIGSTLLMGALLACALFVKLVAVVPGAMLLLADVLWVRPWTAWLKRWSIAACGAALIAIPAAMFCFHQPNFVRDVLVGQVARPRLDMALRLHYLAQNVTRFPPILIGLAAAAYYVVRGRNVCLRSIGLIALFATVLLVTVFKTFFNYYIVQTLPWIAVCFAIAVDAILLRWFAAWRVKLQFALVALLGIAAPLAYAESYERTAHWHVSEPLKIVHELRGGSGCVYSMYPAFALWSERPVCSWYYQADSLIPRIDAWIDDNDFVDLFAHSAALVLYAGELKDYPRAEQYARTHFQQVYTDSDWTLWVRAGSR